MAYINGEKVLRIDLVGNMNQEVDSIREIRAGNSVQFWVGEKADYDKISDAEKVANCMYIVTDDTTATDLQNELSKTTEKVKNITEEQPIVDYIVEQRDYNPTLYKYNSSTKQFEECGISDATWNYRRWKNGRVEIEGGVYISFENGIATTDNMHYINKTSYRYGYPCKLASHPHITVGMGYVGNHGHYWPTVDQFQTNTHLYTPEYRIYTTATEVTEGADGAHICVHIVGIYDGEKEEL